MKRLTTDSRAISLTRIRNGIAGFALLLAMPAAALDPAALVEKLTPEQARRYTLFNDFQIKGVCGTTELDLAQEFGINTIRGYTLRTDDGSTRAVLDEAQARGMRMVVSEWMPHQGKNKGKDGSNWDFDYTKNVEKRLAAFLEKFDAIRDHPAILMWGLGNEVHLDREYLEYVEIMSKAIHERDPLALTSLTMINAKPADIEKIKTYAPDLDVIGVQSYSLGAVRGGIRNMEEHWGKPYYYSEFNGNGPWNFSKTEWGTAYDEMPEKRVADLRACYDAIDAAPRCLGSTAFVWGHFTNQRSSYFSLLLSPHPNGKQAKTPKGHEPFPLITPYAEVLKDRFTGTAPSGNRAPMITKLETIDGKGEAVKRVGEELRVRVEATDADGDDLSYTLWVIGKPGGRYVAASGPFEAVDGVGVVTLPMKARDDYLVYAYAFDGNGAASSTSIPVQVIE